MATTLALPVRPVAQGQTEETIRLLDGGDQAFPRMLAAIEAAERWIHLESYAFAHDRIGRAFIAALGRARARGVDVRVVIDGWGSLKSGRAVAEDLRSSDCRVEIYHPLRGFLTGRFRRNHRKMLLIDDRLAFVGGINIGDEYAGDDTRAGWADLALEMEGPVTMQLARRIRHEKTAPTESLIRIHLSGIGGSWRLHRRYLKAVRSAEVRLLVAHGYFLPDRRLTRAIVTAARRGVAVTLLLAGKSDVPLAHAATMRLYRQFLAAGVRIFEWSASVLHAKAATVDGRHLLVGSFNLDPMSLVNAETLVEISDPATVRAAESWIEAHIVDAIQITDENCHRTRLHRWILDALGLWALRTAELVAHLLGLRRD